MLYRFSGRVVLLALLLSAGGCVYYNTFYFARRHFKDAEVVRKKAEEEERALPAQAVELYGQSLQYSTRVLLEHPDSRWVEEALLLSQKALYYQGEVAASTRKGLELIQHFPESRSIPECRLYLARGLLGLGEALNAAREAGIAAENLKGKLKAEAMLLNARALGFAGQYDESREIFDVIIADTKIPQNIWLQARLELQKLLEEQGEYEEGAAILEEILANQKLSLTTHLETTVTLIDLLLKAGEIPAAEERISHLQDLDDSGYYKGVIRYYRGLLADRRGSYSQATREMVLSLSDGVTAGWEARIRLDLGTQLERGEDYFSAGPEYRAVSGSVGTREQQQQASKRTSVITTYLALRSMVRMVEEDITFRDPRQQAVNIPQPVTQQGRPDIEEDIVRRRRIDPDQVEIDPDILEQQQQQEEEENPQLTLAEQLGDVPRGMYIFMLAEHLVLEMASPDSAVAYLELMVDHHPDSKLVPRALYAITEWAPESEEGNQHREIAISRLTEEFNDTRWAYYYRLGLGENPEKPTELRAHGALVEAEGQIDPLADPADWASVIPVLLEVTAEYPTTEAARMAELTVARLLELGAGEPDSARVAYERIVERYPEYREARVAAERLSMPTTGLASDPLEARDAAINREIVSWNQWFGAQTAAKVVRLPPRGQAAQMMVGRGLGTPAAGRQTQTTTGSGSDPDRIRPGRPPPSRPPPPGN